MIIRGKMNGMGFLPVLVNKKKAAVLSLCLLLVQACFSTASSQECPENCVCTKTTVECVQQNLLSIPQPLPPNITTLFLSGNNISLLTKESFPTLLEQLTEVYLSGNQIEQVDPGAFDNLPSLHLLDLSNNAILNFSGDAFPENNKLQVLNLSRSFCNISSAYSFSNFLKHSVPKLSHLNLSNNDLIVLPVTINMLSDLQTLDLRNNSIVSFENGTFRSQKLNWLDLRDNALKSLGNETLADFGQTPGLRIYLSGNPWLCDCTIEDLVIWLKNTDLVEDKLKMTCDMPEQMNNRPLEKLELAKLPCTYSGEMKGVLETSYVFLGMVLALIGVIFLLVLYLNRKGIKKWIYNIRDACRDHMEGYHYRYEINSDPRLANLSLNSDV